MKKVIKRIYKFQKFLENTYSGYKIFLKEVDDILKDPNWLDHDNKEVVKWLNIDRKSDCIEWNTTFNSYKVACIYKSNDPVHYSVYSRFRVMKFKHRIIACYSRDNEELIQTVSRIDIYNRLGL